MSIASALFASAAPVSTGTSAAASGAAAADVGLFSSKVAAAVAPAPNKESAAWGQPAITRLASAPMPSANDAASIQTPGKPDGFGVLTPSSAAPADDLTEEAAPTEAADKQVADSDALASTTPVIAQPTPVVPPPSAQPVVQGETASAAATEEPSRPASDGTAAERNVATARFNLASQTTAPDATEIETQERLTEDADAPRIDPQRQVATAATEPMKAVSTTTATPATSPGQSADGFQTSATGQPSKNDDAIKTAIAKVMADAQAPTAQIQITTAASAPKPAALTPDAAAAVTTAALVGDAEASAKPDYAKFALPRADMPTPLRADRHDVGQRVEPIPGEASSTPAAPGGETRTVADAATVAPKPPAATDAKAKPADAAPTDAASSQDADVSMQTVATGDATRAPSSAPADHGPALSTLSHATVETTAHLAAQIARRLDGRSTRFDMVLTPEDLGRVDVSLEIGKDGQLSARLAFDNPAAAADLRGRADELRRQLEAAGFQMTEDALDFSQRDPSAGGGFERQQQRNALFAGGGRLAAQADTPVLPAPGAWTNHSLTPDRVDLKV
ncbi:MULTISPECIES: flagellar hook-length control protein FliK [unclassified Brevundimonas]|uniref:flagellar hook-length control protein FliK n=1 Tax=unclassified Brevundimonas TaxID=2622653 RepID=UPI0025BBEC2B|nr:MULTISPECIES: flagellar hook-length control protein FliK [unclassified Brevundimonas]